ncbi:MAG TPA: FtsX-like permease family protein, partial [Puia sp.]|nr:FtsX-like permease family protein [Puia sp.]
VCLLITLYVMDEWSYDRFNVNADRIYRIHTDISYNGNQASGFNTPALTGPTLAKNYPQIEQYVRIAGMGGILVKKGNLTLEEGDYLKADSTIFDVFTLPFITGNPHTALTRPQSLVISKEVALKYFGTVNCLGKTLHINNEKDYTITGVMQDMPRQSHFYARFIQSIYQEPYSPDNNWLNNSYVTYVLVRPGTTEADLDHVLDKFTRSRIMPFILGFFHGKLDHLFDNPENRYRFYSMALTRIHLSNGFNPFTIIAVLILLMACVNFINLSTARSARRAREVGIRKVLGSLRSELIVQFLTESLLTCCAAMLIGIILTISLLPLLNQLSDKNIGFGFLTSGWLLPWLTFTILVVGLVAGLFPAFYLSAFRPVLVLKGKLTAGFRSGWLRDSLVVFQFTIAILLIVGAAVVYRQLDYIRHKDIGFNRDQVLVVRNTYSLWTHALHFKEEVDKLPGVISSTMTFFLPGESNLGSNTYFKDHAMTPAQAVILTDWPVDANYVPTLGMSMAMGRNFSTGTPSDSTAILINETAQHLLGYQDPIGKPLYQPADAVKWPGGSAAYHIIGVIKDFQPNSMHNKVPPMIFNLQEERGGLAIRVHTANLPELIAGIEKAFYSWDKMSGQPFPWHFMDESFNWLYHDDQRTGVLFITFAGLAIFIGCLGLFGLVTYAAEQRTREIGIRKVLGASSVSIARLLSKEFFILTTISSLIAFPLGAWVMQSWLNNFTDHAPISWLIYAAAGALAMTITLLTISFRTIEASRADPVSTLRHVS